MENKYNKNILTLARTLRKDMTKEERHLWYDYLSTYPIKFQRQKILGKYIADFYCASAKLIIELDGSQHYSVEGKQYDNKRTDFLNSYNLTVIRILNRDVNHNFEGVCKYIDLAVKKALDNKN